MKTPIQKVCKKLNTETPIDLSKRSKFYRKALSLIESGKLKIKLSKKELATLRKNATWYKWKSAA